MAGHRFFTFCHAADVVRPVEINGRSSEWINETIHGVCDDIVRAYGIFQGILGDIHAGNGISSEQYIRRCIDELCSPNGNESGGTRDDGHVSSADRRRAARADEFYEPVGRFMRRREWVYADVCTRGNVT